MKQDEKKGKFRERHNLRLKYFHVLNLNAVLGGQQFKACFGIQILICLILPSMWGKGTTMFYFLLRTRQSIFWHSQWPFSDLYHFISFCFECRHCEQGTILSTAVVWTALLKIKSSGWVGCIFLKLLASSACFVCIISSQRESTFLGAEIGCRNCRGEKECTSCLRHSLETSNLMGLESFASRCLLTLRQPKLFCFVF